jgi:anti-sigma factor RsiW
MIVTREVVEDLLAVYLTGEASADTRALVDHWLRRDADLARRVEEARRVSLPQVALPEPSAEKRALVKTRRTLRFRAILLGLAIYVSSLPLSVTFNRSGFHGLLIQDWPERIVIIGLAVALWAVYFRWCRRARGSGL